MPKYPHVHVQLSGEEGNSFSIIGRVCRAMKKAGVDTEDVNAYTEDAMSGDYQHLLTVTCETVTVE